MGELLVALAARIAASPRLTLSCTGLTAIACLALLPSLEIASSRFALIDEDGSVERALGAYGAQGDLVLAVHAEDAQAGRDAVDALASRLAAEFGQDAVWAGLDPTLLHGRELDLVPASELEAVLAAGRPGAPTSLRALLGQSLAPFTSDDTLETLDDDDPLADPVALRTLTGRLERLGRPDAALPPFEPSGHLVSDDRQTRYVFVTPTGSTDRYEEVAPLVARARQLAREVEAAHPVSIALTGYPALAVEEVEAIRDGTLLTGGLATVGVLLLFVLGFRSRGALLIAGLPLGIGMAWAFGGVAIGVGRLTLLTQAAAPVFAGLGIDFSVHLLSGYERARRDGAAHDRALESAMRGPGVGIVTGATTTAGAFFALALAGSDALAELGWIAGGGLLVMMLAVLLVTPALLALADRRGWAPSPVDVSHAAWAEVWARAVTQRKGTVLGVAFLVTVLLAVGLTRLGFNTDVEALMPAHAPSVIAARQLMRQSAFSNELLLAEHRDLDALAASEARLASLPQVGLVQSATPFRRRDNGWRTQLASQRDAPAAPREASVSSSGAGLIRLAEELAQTAAETRALTPAFADALTEASRAARDAEGRLTPDAVARFDRALASDVRRATEIVSRADPARDPFSVDQLPPALRRRLVRAGPRYALYVRPRARVLEGDGVASFVSAVRSVEPDAVGYPIAFGTFLDRLETGVVRASSVALVVVILALVVTFRRTRDVALSLLPVAVGTIWALGTLGWLGVDLDLASVAALPLVLGIGVDDGVHLVHRRRHTPSTFHALVPLTRALVLTTLTTLAGFGTLAFAAHRGMQNFALVMVLGALSCLLATLTVLPAALRTTRRA
ncbi:MAG: MMPL family transporter [Sandaracinaceae bacterium]